MTKEEKREYDREYYKANSEKKKASVSAYRVLNKDKIESYRRDNKHLQVAYVESVKHTLKYHMRIIHTNQIKGKDKRGFDVTYTLEELIEWVKQQPVLEAVFDKWKESGYDNMYSPSINRIDCNGDYSLDNIEIMSWVVNRVLGSYEMCCRKASRGISGVRGVAYVNVKWVVIYGGVAYGRFYELEEATTKRKEIEETIIKPKYQKKLQELKESGAVFARDIIL